MRKPFFTSQLNYPPHNAEDDKESNKLGGQITALDKQITVLNKIMMGCTVLGAGLIISSAIVLVTLAFQLMRPIRGLSFIEWLPVILSRIFLSTAFAGSALLLRWIFTRCLQSIHRLLKERNEAAQKL